MQEDGMTFDEAISFVSEIRAHGAVGISMFHKHEYASIEADEGCYSVYWYDKAGLESARKDAEAEEEPMPAYEITHWEKDDQGDWIGEQLFAAGTIDALLKFRSEQNETKT